MKKKKTILFCGNGMSGEAIRPIKEMGYKVLLITEFLDDRGVEDADVLIEADTKNPEKALEASIELSNAGHHFDGVLSLCWDTPISVSLIAEHFNLFGISSLIAKHSTYKSLRSAIFHKYNVPAPRFKLAKNLAEVFCAAEEIGFPVVLKPLNLSSSKGVILVKNEKELSSAYEYSTSFNKDPQVVVDEYLIGTEHSTEGLMIDGKLFLTAISDREFKYKECEPFFVEIGDIMPTSLPQKTAEEMRIVTEKAALSLGITNGVVKGDIICSNDNTIRILELTPRLGGPRFGTEMVPLSNGTNILKAAVQQAVQDPINMDFLKAKYAKGMVNRSIFPKPGIIKKIEGVESISKHPGYYDFKWWFNPPLKKGDRVNEYCNSCGGVAYFIATGSSRDEALKHAKDIENSIKITTIKS